MDPIWNVQVPVVELIRASSAPEAIRILERELRDKGFEPYEDSDGANAFLSEDQEQLI